MPTFHSPDVAAYARGCGFVQQAARNMEYNRLERPCITLLLFDRQPIRAIDLSFFRSTAGNLLGSRIATAQIPYPSDRFHPGTIINNPDGLSTEISTKVWKLIFDVVGQTEELLMAQKDPGADIGCIVLYQS
jgi:hypothetical protein